MRTNAAKRQLSAGENRKRRGSLLVEFSFVLPWFVFIFVGAFDSGFYAYALMTTQGAAREAALYASSSSSTASDSTTACSYALDQLRGLPNIGNGLSTCGAAPLIVSSTLVSGANSPDTMNAALVTVTYSTPQLIPIPGIFPGQLTITRQAVMRTRS